MYRPEPDPYCYPGTDILINRLDIRDQKVLEAFEQEWAGSIRTVRISKYNSTFCYPEHIEREMHKLFDGLAANGEFAGLDSRQFADKTAAFIAELNAIHPFREGNGRTQLSFLVELSERAGHPLNLDRLDPSAILAATIISFSGDTKPLADILHGLIEGHLA